MTIHPPRRRRLIPVTVLLAVALVLSGCTPPAQSPNAPGGTGTPSTPTSPAGSPGPTADNGEAVLDEHGVSAGHPVAVEAGMQMLQQGGTAADAAVAAGFAVSVVEPHASGIGGGGTSLVAAPGNDVEVIDYRETVGVSGQVPDSGVGAPGFVAGLARLHGDHGTLPWATLLEPAISAATDGVEVSEMLAARLRSDYGPAAIEGQQQFAPGGEPLQAGETLVQPELASTLSTLAEEGPEALYTGSLSDSLAAVPGLDAESLAAVEARAEEPVSAEVGGHTVMAAPPPLPGGPLLAALRSLEESGIAEVDPNSVEFVERVARAAAEAEEASLTRLGDPRFEELPGPQAAAPSSTSSPAAAPVSAGHGAATDRPEADPLAAGSPNTTHLTTVDSSGMVVSMTNTVTTFWGSGQWVDGYVLNNQLSRFEEVDSPYNEPEPGRRSVSWSNPVVVMDDAGRPVLGLGTPGGVSILSTLTNVLTRWSPLDQPLEEAIDAPRFRWDPESGVLFAEEHLEEDIAAELQAAGMPVQRTSWEQSVFGSVQALELDHDAGELIGPADDRRDAAVGIEPAGGD